MKYPGKILFLALMGWVAWPSVAFGLGQPSYVEAVADPGSFALAQGNTTAALYVDSADWPGVVRAAGDLQADLAKVTNHSPAILHDGQSLSSNVVIIGTLGKSAIIDKLIQEKKIEVSGITGKWESFFLQTVADPWPGVSSALVIAGSDKRGTIYGIYDLSEQIGVSPWYWWADVPAPHRDALFIKPGKFVQGEPSVKYRGIFLNDEAPDLTNWVTKTYGTVPGSNGVANYNHEFYARVFELILRLKGNYLWPAMWNNAFNEDDPENPRLADEYGIVMGTSHQEPMLRAQKEWDRGPGRQYGNWNYSRPDLQPALEQFWREGITRNKNYESILTLGLRAENDSGAPLGGDLTEQVIAAQRKLIAEVVNPDVAKVPQLWCLYKEVIDYYNAGLRVPDDVTLLWAEDNWGDIRRLPTAAERARSGGAGIYYHFDYHGSPRNYQWLDSSPLPKIWDQMSLAKQYGADRVWIVNVGHLKGEELPTEFFLSLAWNTNRWTNENLDEFTRLWATREFGTDHAADIAQIVSQYPKFNARRKPELLEPSTYSLTNYQEADNVVADYNALVTKAGRISAELPENRRNAFYELVLFPVKASANLNEMHVAAGKNQLYAQQGRASTNDWAERTEDLFKADANLMDYFNNTFAGGKWGHFMDQVHIGYTSWNNPPQNVMPRVTRLAVSSAAQMGVAVEGTADAWPGAAGEPVLPKFDVFNQQRHYLDVFNKGQEPFNFAAAASAPWIVLSADKGAIEKEQRVWVSVDWSKAPKGMADGTVKISGARGDVSVKVAAFNPVEPARDAVQGFVEGEGVVSIEAEHFTKNSAVGAARWEKVEDYGRTLSAMHTRAPVDAPAATPGKDSPCLEYRMYLFSPGQLATYLVVAPTLNFDPTRGLRVAVSFDDEVPQTLTLVPQNFSAQNGNRDWEESVRINARYIGSTHAIAQAGYHTLKIWMVDPAVVLEKIFINTGGLQGSYLGPPESFHRLITDSKQ